MVEGVSIYWRNMIHSISHDYDCNIKMKLMLNAMIRDEIECDFTHIALSIPVGKISNLQVLKL